MTEGVTEQKIRLDYILNQFSKVKVKKCKPVIRCILRMAAYEIFYMDSVPDEAACNEYVNLTAKRGFRTLKGYMNGVLRNVCRNKAAIIFPKKEDGLEAYLSVKYSIPEELVKFLLNDYSAEQLEQILQAGETNRGTTVRVNTMHTTLEEFRNNLIEKGIKVEKDIIIRPLLLFRDMIIFVWFRDFMKACLRFRMRVPVCRCLQQESDREM